MTDHDLRRQLLVGIGALLAVAVLLGSLIAVVTLKVADVAGIGDATTSTETNTKPPKGLGPSKPSRKPTSEPTPTGPAGPTEPATTSQQPPRPAIALTASPQSVGTYERINLTGRYPGGDGTTLQVQRKEGANWADFPTDATVGDGRFSTYVETGRSGLNLFRMFDPSSGRASNPVTVTVG